MAIYFPPAEKQGDSTPPMGDDASAAMAPFGRGRKVMIVDDDAAVLRLGYEIINLAGFVPEAHSNPLSALKKFEAAPQDYAAVVSDLTMPGMTGMELARHVRQLRPSLPFVLASGYLHADAQGGAQASGVVHVIKKPFDIHEFTAKLRSALTDNNSAG